MVPRLARGDSRRQSQSLQFDIRRQKRAHSKLMPTGTPRFQSQHDLIGISMVADIEGGNSTEQHDYGRTDNRGVAVASPAGPGTPVNVPAADINQAVAGADSMKKPTPAENTTMSFSKSAAMTLPDYKRSPTLGLFGSGVDSGGAFSSTIHSSSTPQWGQGLNILVVDDSAPNRKVLRRLLLSHQHRVMEAGDGLEFLNLMEESFVLAAKAEGETRDGIMRPLTSEQVSKLKPHYDVILMDHFMPQKNGSEATAAVRQRGYNGLIVGLTGHMMPEDVEHFKSSGANDVLPKPLKIDDLKQIVTRFFDKCFGYFYLPIICIKHDCIRGAKYFRMFALNILEI